MATSRNPRPMTRAGGAWVLTAAVMGFSFCAVDATAQRTPEAVSETAAAMTLEQFRSLAASRLAQTAPVAGRPGRQQPQQPTAAAAPVPVSDEPFLQLLLVQAQKDAAHQSLDRLSGWSKAIQSRFQTQTAPELDWNMIQFEEASRTAEAAQIEDHHQRAVERANRLLGRPAQAPLTALPLEEEGENAGYTEQFRKALTQGEELVARMYRNYQFGGVSLPVLLQYEKALYEADVNYRTALARRLLKASSVAAAN